ncbi:MAG: hypothetical protein U0556_10625 [Dehalococcoidia bacterium]
MSRLTGWRRVGLLALRWAGGAVIGAALGGLLQLASGVAGWALVGAGIGLVSVTFWYALRDPRR